jgi:hypothetical protein
MKPSIAYFFFAVIILTDCQNQYYTVEDFQGVKKIDSHVHLNSDKGFFEDQANKDNFLLITLGVDHSDSASVNQQLAWELNSIKKYPCLVLKKVDIVITLFSFSF